MCVCLFFRILDVSCFGKTVLKMCMECHSYVNMYRVSAQGVGERMINVHLNFFFPVVI